MRDIIILIITIILGFIFLKFCIDYKSNALEKSFIEELHKYKYLVVDGIEYNTNDITKINYCMGGESPDNVIIVFNNGDIVNFDITNYSLKK